MAIRINTGPEDVAGPNANARLQELARRVAEAHIDLRRVRDARHQLLSNALSDPYYDSRANNLAKLRLLPRLVGPNAPEISIDTLTKFLSSTPQGPNKFATIVSEEAKRLIAMDRYERRALFRREIAIQAFDEAWARLQIEVADRDPRGNSAAIPVSASKYASAKGCIQRLSRPQNEAKIINDFKGAGASVNLAYYANVPA